MGEPHSLRTAVIEDQFFSVGQEGIRIFGLFTDVIMGGHFLK